VANGLKVSETALPGNLKLTHWKEATALPTKVTVIGVADFAVDHTGDVKGIPVYTYVFPENKDVGFKSYAVAKEILAYFMDKLGPYAYEKLANVQSKTIFGGMENASSIFYFENSVGDKGIESLMAHEIAHQWFGDAASEKNFSHLWLSEGFATYMTNVYLEHKYGADTLKKRLKADRLKIFQFEKSRVTPVVDTTVKDNYMVMLNANSYEKGGWVLHMLQRKLGDEAFWKGIRAYYAKYNGGNANTDDLRTIMEQASGQDLQQFFKQWLFTTGHPQLAINWKYDPLKKAVNIRVTQKQDLPYEFTLECLVGKKLHRINVKNKTTTISLPVMAKPLTVTFDPDVNLLAGIEVAKVN
jgi:aminopeptidase N